MNEREKLEQAIATAKEIHKRQKYSRIDFYDPYPFQKNFHDTGFENNQRLLMCANRIGKSYCGAAEMAMHLTGLYPDWWQGRKYRKAITAWNWRNTKRLYSKFRA